MDAREESVFRAKLAEQVGPSSTPAALRSARAGRGGAPSGLVVGYVTTRKNEERPGGADRGATPWSEEIKFAG